MKRKIEKVLKISLALAMIFSSLFYVTTPVSAESVEYEIYPNPHDIQYQDGDYIIRDEVNVVYDSKVNADQATKDRLAQILEAKGKENVAYSDQTVEGKTNIYVATYTKEGEASSIEMYIRAKIGENNLNVLDKFGGHIVYSSNDEIFVLGRDTDAAFYGVTTLKHIFNQMDGSTIRNFMIKDYADTNIRGFIEGYYGNPWSYKDRMSLMELGGEFKMTSYMFAPKDDPYHTNKWREMYPADELAKIKEAAELGNSVKCRFVWTAHPFKGGFDPNNVEGEIESLLAKFDQLYNEAGVRQFGVLGDDVGTLNRSVVIQVMKAVSDWAKAKGDVYDTVFCPAGYNHGWQNGNEGNKYSELTEYDKEFPEDIQIFWTGEAVCQPVEQITLDHFKTFNTASDRPERRSPLFWLNWPVNDVNGHRLMMGKGSLLHTDINVDDLAGVVTNPMQEAQASKVAIFAVADYAWNVKGFNADKSWEDSFKYIEPNATEALHTLAKHMSNPQPNGHGLVLAESEELQPLINEVKTKLANGEPLGESGEQLIEEMEIIMKACDEFHTLSKNTRLKEEMKPFTDSLKDLTTAIKLFAETEKAFAVNDKVSAFENHTKATAILLNSRKHMRECVGNYYPAAPGSTHLIPLADKFVEVLKNPINEYISNGDAPLQITASSSFNTWHAGNINNIIDGNPKTYAWHNGGESVGQYYQLNFSKPSTIYGIHIENGAGEDKPDDTFAYAKLKYTTDGTTWKEVSSKEYGEYINKVDIEVKLQNVLAVRYECSKTKDGKWPSMREFSVDLLPNVATEFSLEPIHTTDGWSIYDGNAASRMVDGNLSTFAQFNVRQHASENVNSMIPGDYVGVKLSKPIVLGRIQISQVESGDDYIKNGMLQYSNDGENWTDIQSTTERNIDVDVSDKKITAQYVRLMQTKKQGNWLSVREFSVDMAYVTPDYTMEVIRPGAEDKWGIYEGNDQNVIDGNDTSYVKYRVRNDDTLGLDKDHMFAGDYIGVKLSKPIVLGQVHILQGQSATDKDYIKNATLQYSLDGNNWQDIDDFQDKRELDIDLSSQNIVAQYVRLKQNAKQNNWLGMREFQVEAKTFFNGNVYTNVTELEKIKANYFDEINYIEQFKDVTLENGEYIGLKLDRIHELKEITADFSDATGLTIQVAENTYEWKNVEAGTLSDNARFIRIINNSGTAKTFKINEFVVKTNEVVGESLFGTNYTKIGNPLNVFDGDWTTQTTYENNQIDGKYFIYDLGQIIHFDTFKAVCRDSEIDFPRHAKFYVSTDNQNWEEIMSLGNQDGDNSGEADSSDEIKNALPDHEISYNTKSVTGINKEARYLKFEITRTKSGADKWVRFQELEINGGEYVPTVNNPTFKSDCKDTENGLFEYMTDSDVSTMFIPNKDNGYITYSISDNNNVNAIKIIQNSSVISNALVSARIVSKSKIANEWIELGKLSRTINEFVMPTNTTLLEIKIEWKDVIPNLSELLIYSSEYTNVNKDLLNNLITNLEDTSTWTTNSKNTYITAINQGKEVKESDFVSKTMVDETIKSIQDAINYHLTKGDTTELESLASEQLKASLYTAKTWKTYTKALDNAKEALKDKDNLTEEMITTYENAIKSAKNALVYNPSESEMALLLERECNIYISSLEEKLYTKDSYSTLLTAYNVIKGKLEENKTTPVNPDVFAELNLALIKAKLGLVEVLTLPSLIAEYEKAKEFSTYYTQDSFARYTKAIETGKQETISGSDESVDIAIESINAAKLGLSLSEYNVDAVRSLWRAANSIVKNEYSEDTDYTEVTYGNLKEIIDNPTIDIETATSEELKSYAELVKEKMDALVSIVDLKDAVVIAESFDSSKYTPNSYVNLETAISEAKALYENGTAAQILTAISNITTAIGGIELRVNKEEALTYINAIVEIDYKLYTDTTGKEYKDAYTVLSNMKKDIDNVGSAEYIRAKEIFETAVSKLEYLKADYTNVKEAIGKVPPVLDIYTSETVEILNNAIDSVDWNLNITQKEQVADFAQAILDAIDGLVTKESVERLTTLLDEAKATDKNKYTQKSYDEFLETVTQLEEDAGDISKLSQQQVDTFYQSLTQAKNNLVARGNTSQLNELLASAKAKDESSYTKESYGNLTEAITKIEEALKDTSNMTQEEVDALYAELNKAVESLVARGNTTKLDELLDAAKSKEESSYTKESYDNLTKAITKIEEELKDTSNMTQEQVDALYAELNRALNDLKEKPTPEDPEQKPGTGDEDNGTDIEVKPNPTPDPDDGADKDQTQQDNDKTDTGDSSAVGLFGIVGVVSLGVVCFLLMKKRKND